MNMKVNVYKPFGYMYDEMNRKHRCLWDPNNTTQDKHERAALIHKRLLADGLLDDAVMVKRNFQSYKNPIIIKKIIINFQFAYVHLIILKYSEFLKLLEFRNFNFLEIIRMAI